MKRSVSSEHTDDTLAQLKHGQTGLTAEEKVQVADAVGSSLAKRTLKAYASDWKDFVMWCGQRTPMPLTLPASPFIVATYLYACATRGKKAATISRRAAAIATMHRLEGQVNPCATQVVSRALIGIRRKLGVRPVKKRPMVYAILARVVKACVLNTKRGLRDRALVTVGYATALRRENLVDLKVSDVTFTEEGLSAFVAKGKTDQEGTGRFVGVVKSGGAVCAVESLKAWLAACPMGSNVPDAPLFRRVGRDDEVHAKAMSTDGVADAVKRLVKKAGLDPTGYSAHSMRAGHATQAARNKAMPQEIMELGGWKRLDTVMGYIREADPVRNTSASKIWPEKVEKQP